LFFKTFDLCMSASCKTLPGLFYCDGSQKCCNKNNCEKCVSGKCVNSCASNECLSCANGVCSNYKCNILAGKICKPKNCKGSACKCTGYGCNNSLTLSFNTEGAHEKWFCPSITHPGWCVNPDKPSYTETQVGNNPNTPICHYDHNTKCVKVVGDSIPHQGSDGKWTGSVGCWPSLDNNVSNFPFG
jgi:hypothetical protein